MKVVDKLDENRHPNLFCPHAHCVAKLTHLHSAEMFTVTFRNGRTYVWTDFHAYRLVAYTVQSRWNGANNNRFLYMSKDSTMNVCDAQKRNASRSLQVKMRAVIAQW